MSLVEENPIPRGNSWHKTQLDDKMFRSNKCFCTRWSLVVVGKEEVMFDDGVMSATLQFLVFSSRGYPYTGISSI